MAFPKIPLVGYWNNQFNYRPKFTKTEFGRGGRTTRSISQWINPIAREISVQGAVVGTLADKENLDGFLRGRDGKPFGYYFDNVNLTGNFTCTDYSFSWEVFVPDAGGVWIFSGTFIENFNPET